MITIDLNAFAPWPALIGGALIGLSAAMLILLNGRIAGISGIVGGLLKPVRGDVGWRLAFVAGLTLAAALFATVAAVPPVHIDAGYGALIAGGVLVGIGTRYAAGCTSGHGVCGLSRLSPRSLAATVAFIGAGFITVFVARHLLHL